MGQVFRSKDKETWNKKYVLFLHLKRFGGGGIPRKGHGKDHFVLQVIVIWIM